MAASEIVDVDEVLKELAATHRELATILKKLRESHTQETCEAYKLMSNKQAILLAKLYPDLARTRTSHGCRFQALQRAKQFPSSSTPASKPLGSCNRSNFCF
jgi:hypothetical protein